MIKMTSSEIERREALVKFAKKHFAETTIARDDGGKTPLAAISGSVIYSAYHTLRRGDVYFLGVNPGGNPGNPDEPTISEHFARTIADAPCNGYWCNWRHCPPPYSCSAKPNRKLSQPWGLRDCGRYLLCLLSGCNCRGDKTDCKGRNICASNISFIRGLAIEKAKIKLSDAADLCWPIHEAIIKDVVRPRLIVTHGRAPYAHLSRKLAPDAAEEKRRALHAKLSSDDWFCRIRRASLSYGEIAILQIPHLARYALHRPSRAEVVEWIKSKRG